MTFSFSSYGGWRKAYPPYEIAHHWHWLSDGQYQHVSEMVAEIGRLLGGWLKRALSET